MDNEDLIGRTYTGDIINLHNEIEIKLLDLLFKFCDWKDEGLLSCKFKSIENTDYRNASKICFCMNIVDEKLFIDLKKFGTGRNKFAHRKFSWYVWHREKSKVKEKGDDLFRFGDLILQKLEKIEEDLDRKRDAWIKSTIK